MAFVNEYVERQSYPGFNQDTIGPAPVAYPDAGGILRRIEPHWLDEGGPEPLVVSKSKLRIRMAPNGDYRILPVPSDDDAWFSLSSPFVRQGGGGWFQPNLGPFTRQGNLLHATTANVQTFIWHGGHFLKPGWLLENLWRPLQRQFAFRVGLQGLNRQGGLLLHNGVPVMHVRAPIAYDYADPSRTWPIAHDFVQLDGDWYVLFTLPAETDGIAELMVDPQLVLQPGAAAGKDTMIWSGQPTWNYGVNAWFMYLSSFKGLNAFTGCSAIPSGAVCTAAVFNAYQGNSGAAQAWTVTIYPIAIGNAAWPEGTKASAVGGAGDSCWNFLDQGGAGTPWAGSAGLSTLGTDYENLVMGTFSGNRSDLNGTEYACIFNAAGRARVQGWFGSPNTNYGMLFIASADLGSLPSSDHATPAWRPKLVVDWLFARVAGKSLLHPYAFQRIPLARAQNH